jgi:hypothetical protein
MVIRHVAIFSKVDVRRKLIGGGEGRLQNLEADVVDDSCWGGRGQRYSHGGGDASDGSSDNVGVDFRLTGRANISPKLVKLVWETREAAEKVWVMMGDSSSEDILVLGER